MSKVLAYFIGGSHDLSKRWLEDRCQCYEVPKLCEAPHPVAWRHNDGCVTEAIFTIERYVRVCKLRGQRDAYVYEYRPNE